MNKTLHWKVVTLLGYVAALTAILVMGSDGALLSGTVILRLASPL